MPVWLIAILTKLIALPILAYLYWLLAIKGGEWLAKLIPSAKWRRILTEPRYDLNLRNPRREPFPTCPPSQSKHPE